VQRRGPTCRAGVKLAATHRQLAQLSCPSLRASCRRSQGAQQCAYTARPQSLARTACVVHHLLAANVAAALLAAGAAFAAGCAVRAGLAGAIHQVGVGRAHCSRSAEGRHVELESGWLPPAGSLLGDPCQDRCCYLSCWRARTACVVHHHLAANVAAAVIAAGAAFAAGCAGRA